MIRFSCSCRRRPLNLLRRLSFPSKSCIRIRAFVRTSPSYHLRYPQGTDSRPGHRSSIAPHSSTSPHRHICRNMFRIALSRTCYTPHHRRRLRQGRCTCLSRALNGHLDRPKPLILFVHANEEKTRAPACHVVLGRGRLSSWHTPSLCTPVNKRKHTRLIASTVQRRQMSTKAPGGRGAA